MTAVELRILAGLGVVALLAVAAIGPHLTQKMAQIGVLRLALAAPAADPATPVVLAIPPNAAIPDAVVLSETDLVAPAVSYAATLVAVAPAAAAPAPNIAVPSALFAATLTLPCAGLEEQDVAAVLQVAASLATLRVWGEAASALEQTSLVRYALITPLRRLALAAALHPVALLAEVEPAEGDPLHARAEARILPSARDAQAALRNALRQDVDLDLREIALDQARRAVDMAVPLIENTARSAEDLARIRTLAAQLQTLDEYQSLLREFDGQWRAPVYAERSLRKLLAVWPDNPLYELGLGEALLQLKRPYEALEILNDAARQPDFPARGFYARGVAQVRLHMHPLGIADFSRAIELQPDRAALWRARGTSRLLSSEPESAVCPDLRQACALGDCEGLSFARQKGLCLPETTP